MKLTTSTGILALKHKVFRALMLLSALLLLPVAVYAQGKHAYAIWTEDNATLTFTYIEDEYYAGNTYNHAEITNIWIGDQVLNTPVSDKPEWYSKREKIETVIFEPDFIDARPKSIAYWFDNSSEITSAPSNKLTAIVGLQYLDTREVTSMNHAFYRCAQLTDLDLSHFNTSSVTDMSYMFAGCTSLTQIDLSRFNTQSVNTMKGMFSQCSGLTSLNLSGCATASVTDMSEMFNKCSSLSDIDFTNFNTANVTTFDNMFGYCSLLKDLDITSFDVTSLTSAVQMFYYCGSLKTIRTAEDADWSTNSPDITNMFGSCNNLQAVGNDHSTCKYVRNVNKPWVCQDGDGYFTAIKGFLITFKDGSSAQEAYQITDDKNVTTVMLNPDSNFEPPEGKIFGSWNTMANGSGTAYYEGDNITVSDNIVLYAQWGKDIAECDFSINPKSYTYSGSECAPTATVEDNFTKLTLNRDYTVSYANNINVGSDATIIIRGKGYYAGTVTETFAIKPLDISVASITPQRAVLPFNGEVQAPTYILRNDNIKLVAGIDYTESGNTGHSAVGNYTVTFTGQGNYTGTATAVYAISAQKAYAVWTEDNKTLTFLLTEEDINEGDDFNGNPVTAVWSGNAVLNSPQDGVPLWNSVVADVITTVVIDPTFAEACPKSIAYWFANTTSMEESANTLRQIQNLQYLNTSAVTSMQGAFAYCSKPTRIDISKFTTDLVTDMSRMFMGCSSVQRLDVQKFVTDNVTDMQYMFYDCTKLTKASTENFDTRNVTNMSGMFMGCSALSEVAISSFNTENVESMKSMFALCPKLKIINLAGFATSNVKSMSNMFDGCTSLTSLRFGGLNTSQVTDMSCMFRDCQKITSLDLSSFNTANVGYMNSMFEGCTSLSSLTISSFNTAEVVSMNSMFKDCSALPQINVSKFYTPKLEDAAEMFANCASVQDVNIAKFDIRSLSNTNSMFAGCSSLVTIVAKAGANWSGISDYSMMFDGCTSLIGVGADGTICQYDDTDQPFVCADGHGYFTPDDIYIITFNNNLDGQLAYQAVSKSAVGSIQLLPNIFSYDDEHGFVGWNTLADGKGISYKDEAYIRISANITLYARWGKDIQVFCEADSYLEPSDYVYTGRNVYPERYVILDGNKQLEAGTDFGIIQPSDGINVGTYEVKIVGQGEYSGSFSLPYYIIEYDLMDVTIEPEDAVLMYNGEAQVPTFTLRDNNNNVLIEGTDYNIITNTDNNISGGTYSVDFEGINNYIGETYTSYSIKNAFAVWSEDNTTLTFVYSGVGYTTDPHGKGFKSIGGNKVTAVWQGDDVINTPADGTPIAWAEILDKVTNVVFDESFAGVLPASTAYWFANAKNLTEISDLEYLNTSAVTSMASMFANCELLADIDLGSFKTSQVTTMAYMFNGCKALKEVNVESFSTNKVKHMESMFAGCSSLARIIAKSDTDWRNSNPATDDMFAGDTQLMGVGSDGTYCLYQEGANLPFACRTRNGYFTAGNFNIITFDNNIEDRNFAFQSIAKTTTAPQQLKSLATMSFEREGYLFVHWNTEPDGNGTDYNDRALISLTGNITLYAIWRRDIASSDIEVVFDPAEPVYTGSKIEPSITLTDGDYTLLEGTDYSVYQYGNNTNASDTRPYVEVRGKGNKYSGVAWKYFPIKPKTLTTNMIVITSGSTTLEYNKSAQAPAYSLRDNNTTLVNGRDYTMSSIANNINVNTYTITYTGTGNYTGEVTADYEIIPRNIGTYATLSQIPAAEYNGASITPDVVVKDGNKVLNSVNEDYTVYFGNNINAGNANVTITGKGNYTGTLTGSFVINPLSFAKITVTPTGAQLPYNRTAQNPVFALTFGDNNVVSTNDYTVAGINKTAVGNYTATFIPTSTNYTGSTTANYSITKYNLSNARIVFNNEKNNIYTYTGEPIYPSIDVYDEFNNKLDLYTDYTLTYDVSTEIGTYNLTVSADNKPNYTGSLQATYYIVDKTLEDADVVVNGDPFIYTGSAIEPTVSVSINGRTLTKDSDFTIAYDNNVNAGTTAKITLTGIGTYTGSAKEVLFTINPQDIASATVVAGDSPVYTGEAQVPSFTVTDANSITLTAGQDYTVGDYANNKDADDYTVTLSGIGNYTGSVDVDYSIVGLSIENYIITIDDEEEKEYTGSPQTLSISVCADALKQYCLVEDQDYTISYDANQNVGEASVFVDGTGNYLGRCTQNVTFDIVPMPYSADNITIEVEKPESAEMPEIQWTGEPQMPAYVITDKHGNTLAEGVDYSADYSANKEIGGPYTVVLNFSGNYSGVSPELTYKIVHRNVDNVQVVFTNENKEYTYTGEEINAVKKVTDLGHVLQEGTDYDIQYADNIEPGDNTAKVTITGLGAYEGSESTEYFTIKKIEMSAVTVELSATEFIYDKTEQQPTYTLTDPNGHELTNEEFTVSGIDDNVEVGTYTITFTAAENSHYDGSTTAQYTIITDVVDPTKVTVTLDKTEFIYDGNAQQPEVVVAYDGTTLSADTDYDVAFGDNINAGAVSVTVTGKGNYSGFTVEADPYNIQPRPLANNAASADNGKMTYNGAEQKPTITVLGIDNAKLVAGRDYTVTLSADSKNAGNYTAKVEGKGNYKGVLEVSYTIEPFDISGANSVVVFKGGNEYEYTGFKIKPVFEVKVNGMVPEYEVSGDVSAVNAGKDYKIVITGTGNFKGTQTATYSIKPRNIETTVEAEIVDADTYVETGSEIKPEVVVYDGDVLLDPSDYVVTYADNVKAGTGKVFVKGSGNYEGFETSVEFTILTSSPEIKFNVEDGASLVYGNSLVGKDVKAAVDAFYAARGTISYDVEGLLAPGKQTVTASYTINGGSITSTAKINVNVAQRLLQTSGVEVASIKDYDGNTSTTVTKLPELSNIINDDEVTITATAEFASAKPGKQPIYVTYTLSGNDADRYTVNNVTLEGEIKTVEIAATASVDVDASRSSAIDYMSSDEQNDLSHYCAGDEIVIKCTVSSGMPTNYTVNFSDTRLGRISGTYPADGVIVVKIPSNVPYGKYMATVLLENTVLANKKEVYSVEFYVDGSVDGEDAIIKTKWDDVVYVSNASREFASYEWYKDGKPIVGENGQYYQEKGGLQNAVYSAKIMKADGGVVFSCPFKPTKAISKVAASSVKVYPNPVYANQQFTVEIENVESVDGNVSIIIFNHSGMLVKRIDNASAINHISLPAGQYTGTAVVDGKQMTFRVIVQ